MVAGKSADVREGDMTPSQPDAVEIRDVAQSTLLLHELTLGPVLRRMRMDHHATRACKLADFLQQLARTTDRKPWRETVTNTAPGFPMPLVKQRQRLFDRIRGLFLQSARDLVALVHHALANCGAKPGFLDDLKHLARVIDCLHRERASGAALDELSNAKTCRRCDRGRRVRCLHGPNALLQPIDE